MSPTDRITCRPIGFIRSPFTDTAGMPIQTAGAPGERGTLAVLPEFVPGLRDIEGFEYLLLVTHLHRVAQERLEVTPFLDDQSHGVFATRAPARPNRIGLSIVRLEALEGPLLHFSGNDMLDGTPVLDIKPYVPQFDVRATERIGWFAKRVHAVGTTRSDHRMD
ncbi:tRNA (N6-threonylcarbamoyladenosine(37)-N6)-methyltransferase TrmO [Corticibacter populi]|uniref:tRNA (N6-threonylcarbamoyladenosine(37)-N6)-methyltransferase TrmO n=1 Tax=Corticibacter populi TaxID=1550736 RepID=A0A3M6QME1_9BURK|nr:tRNA (N6-threonylcarbamoyladenosine(37)-N6)-methyltransferase TrmO [Corticibacter populi]RMX04227.1 tRNA (N6-threonylcarbamoyladenosine(37)-N6)-methyltransferase TrmO [Corticibacter populi]RZS33262.1 tRNA-Thr(GGU) m(6)t(6)A37 methyltransferase TsaA [Corticibacter populi]